MHCLSYQLWFAVLKMTYPTLHLTDNEYFYSFHSACWKMIYSNIWYTIWTFALCFIVCFLQNSIEKEKCRTKNIVQHSRQRRRDRQRGKLASSFRDVIFSWSKQKNSAYLTVQSSFFCEWVSERVGGYVTRSTFQPRIVTSNEYYHHSQSALYTLKTIIR